MSVLEIVKYPNKILKQKTKIVRGITAETKKLIKNMIETMKKNNGIGLAANQVGVSLRILTVALPDENKKITEAVLINPVIQKKSGRVFEEEGCLSFPGLYLKIKRAKYVKVNAVNERGKVITIEGEGLLIRVLQHEIDHLDGKTFIDRLPVLKKLKTIREINRRIKKGNW